MICPEVPLRGIQGASIAATFAITPIYCELNKNIKNRSNRELSVYEIDRIKWMHGNGLAKPLFSKIIDTTNKNVNEITDLVITELELKRKTLRIETST